MGLFLNGAAGENRTHDPVLTKDVRYHYATAATVLWYVTKNKAYFLYCTCLP